MEGLSWKIIYNSLVSPSATVSINNNYSDWPIVLFEQRPHIQKKSNHHISAITKGLFRGAELYFVTNVIHCHIESRGWRRHFSLISSILFKPNHLMICLKLHWSFSVLHIQLILLCCHMNQNRCLNKKRKKYSFHGFQEWMPTK